MRAPPSSPTIRLTGRIAASERKWPCEFSGRLPLAAELPTVGRDYCRQALALAEKLGMGRLVAYRQLGLGNLDRRAD